LSGRNVIFILEILTVRDASEEELEAGGPLGSEPDLDEILSNPGTTVH
jgi:FKBP-type peptidyl-prolyl cis-trans isomerase SlyD